MNAKKGYVKNSIGMFDLLKGMAMVLIVFAHTLGLFALDVSSDRFSFSIVLAGALELGKSFLMPVFFVMSGFGFRKSETKKVVSAYLKELIVPYLIAVALTVILNTVIHYSFFKYLPGALGESLKLLGGSLLGTSVNVSLFNTTLFACGPIWFLLALFWAGIVFNIVLNVSSEKMLPAAVFAVSLAGWGLSYLKIAPWCISQGLVGVLFLYIGYTIKRKKVINEPMSGRTAVLSAVIIVIPNVLLTALRKSMNMADNLYPLGPVSYVFGGLFGILVLYGVVRLNRFGNPLLKGLKKIGYISLYFLCFHSVEMMAFPWYLVAERFADKIALGIAVIFVTRLAAVLICCFLLEIIIKGIRKAKVRRMVQNG